VLYREQAWRSGVPEEESDMCGRGGNTVWGVVTSDGGRDFIVQLSDGRTMVFENDARLFEVVKGVQG